VRGRRDLVNLQADEGTTPYGWTLIRGRLPRGLHLTRDGAIMGIARGRRHHQRVYRCTAEVKDATNPTQSATQILVIKLRRQLIIDCTAEPRCGLRRSSSSGPRGRCDRDESDSGRAVSGTATARTSGVAQSPVVVSQARFSAVPLARLELGRC
jgi:hypothetical protein